MSLSDTGVDTSTIDTGAALSLYSPDIPTSVASPSFDPSINYLQSPVPGVAGSYDPTGLAQAGPQAVDATQAGIVNGQTAPISTEDAVAYSATLGTAQGTTTTFGPSGFTQTDAQTGQTTQFLDPSGSGIKNASGLTGSQNTTSVTPGAGQPNAAMHGISDALTSLINVGIAVDTLSNVKSPTTTQGTATPQAQGVSGLLSPLTSRLQTPPSMSAVTVPGPGLIGSIGGGSSLPMLILIAVAAYLVMKHG